MDVGPYAYGRSIVVLSSTDQQLSMPKLLHAWAPQVETNTDLDRPPSGEEARKAMKQLSPGKATGADVMPAEAYRHGGDTLLQKLTDLFCRMWDEEVIHQQFKDASIIHLYKKGNSQLCDNYRGISLDPGQSREDIGTDAAQPPDSPLGTRHTSRESMRFPRWPWDR